MAYRELGMVELREIPRRWLAGDGLRAIARATGMDRKTVAEYVRTALAVGVQRGGPDQPAPWPPSARAAPVASPSSYRGASRA
jgi:transposase